MSLITVNTSVFIFYVHMLYNPVSLIQLYHQWNFLELYWYFPDFCSFVKILYKNYIKQIIIKTINITNTVPLPQSIITFM